MLPRVTRNDPLYRACAMARGFAILGQQCVDALGEDELDGEATSARPGAYRLIEVPEGLFFRWRTP